METLVSELGSMEADFLREVNFCFQQLDLICVALIEGRYAWVVAIYSLMQLSRATEKNFELPWSLEEFDKTVLRRMHFYVIYRGTSPGTPGIPNSLSNIKPRSS